METICYMSRPEWESPELANYILHWQLNMSQMGYLPWGPQQGYWSAYHPQCLPTLPRMPIANIAPSSSATRPFVGVAGGAPKAATGDLLLAASPQTKRLHYTEGGEHRPTGAYIFGIGGFPHASVHKMLPPYPQRGFSESLQIWGFAADPALQCGAIYGSVLAGSR